jgi:putative FmdB family regulatory protein
MKYLYKCNNCQEQVEVEHSMKEEPVIECEKCLERMRRVIQAVPIKFKGSGFYVNSTE